MPKITIQETEFEVAAPFKAGHVLTEKEAGALNQTYTENLRNNFAAKMKKWAEAKEKDPKAQVPTDLQAEFAAYAKDYEFGERKGGGSRDPIEAEMRRIAKAAVENAVRAKGVDVKSVSKEKMDAFIAQAIATRPEIRKEAERRVKQARGVVDLDLDLSGAAKPKAAPQAPAAQA